MKVLIIYATGEGQTAKIATAVAEWATDLGHDVALSNANETEDVSLDDVDAAIFAAPVHQRRHPRKFEALVLAHKSELKKIRTMMLSVSLSAAFPEGMADAQDYLLEMKMRTKFEPDQEMLVAGAVRLDEYDYFALQVVRHVVLRDRPYDPNEGTHEFTDWGALRADIDAFLG